MELTQDAILKLVLLIKDRCECFKQIENSRIAAALCLRIGGLSNDEECIIRRMFADGLSLRAAALLVGLGLKDAKATAERAIERLGRLIQEELR